jgi:hypothetical protein
MSESCWSNAEECMSKGRSNVREERRCRAQMNDYDAVSNHRDYLESKQLESMPVGGDLYNASANADDWQQRRLGDEDVTEWGDASHRATAVHIDAYTRQRTHAQLMYRAQVARVLTWHHDEPYRGEARRERWRIVQYLEISWFGYALARQTNASQMTLAQHLEVSAVHEAEIAVPSAAAGVPNHAAAASAATVGSCSFPGARTMSE